MTGIQTNFTAADMLGGYKNKNTAAPAPKKPAFFSAPAPAPVVEPEIVVEEIVKEDVVSENEEY
jgi:hypothetical protein